MLSVDWRVIVYKQSAHGGRECGRGTSAGHRNWAFISQHPVLPSAWAASGVFPISPGRTAAAPSYSFSFWRVLPSPPPCSSLNSSSVDGRGAILPKPPGKLRRASGGRAGGTPSACSAPPPLFSSCRTTPSSADGCWLLPGRVFPANSPPCPRPALERHFHEFLSSPLRVGAWHLAFVVLVGSISARGVNRGIELANKIRAPGLLILLLILVAYALVTGDVSRGLAFAFAPGLRPVVAQCGPCRRRPSVLCHGGRHGNDACLRRVCAARCVAHPRSAGDQRVDRARVAARHLDDLPARVSLRAEPGTGSRTRLQRVADVFWEMPGGRMVGILFFLLLVLAALTPSLAGLEPMVAWLVQRRRIEPVKSGVRCGSRRMGARNRQRAVVQCVGALVVRLPALHDCAT